jgi:hypothetical protein
MRCLTRGLPHSKGRNVATHSQRVARLEARTTAPAYNVIFMAQHETLDEARERALAMRRACCMVVPFPLTEEQWENAIAQGRMAAPPPQLARVRLMPALAGKECGQHDNPDAVIVEIMVAHGIRRQIRFFSAMSKAQSVADELNASAAAGTTYEARLIARQPPRDRHNLRGKYI